MLRFALTLLAVGLFAFAQIAPSPVGDWSGSLNLGAATLRVVFHIKADADGYLTATLDSPDQGAAGIPVPKVISEGAKLRIDMSNIRASFEGAIVDAGPSKGNEISGIFSQGGADLPLTLKRLTANEIEAAKPKRSQVPVKPYPYEERDVTAVNKSADGVTLACTLTVPRGEGPFPAVLTITGSGPQTRDEEVMGQPVFLVLADHLTRKGIAVLRCDDRGIGKSTGAFAKATTADFAIDVEAEFDALKAQSKIDPRRCGLIGHSEGGVIAPMVAGRRADVAFVVLLAGTGVPGRTVILSQKEAILKASGQPAPDLTADQATYEAILAGKGENAILETAKGMFPPGTADAAIKQQIQNMMSPWFVYFLKYDPAAALAKVKQPVLALFGEKDLQVLPSVNEPPVRTALKDHKNARVEIVPGVNHLFQKARTGVPAEYSNSEETISPKALNLISDWILALKL